jgi:hypothetical protein
MGREAALISDWDFPIAGREPSAESVFREFLSYWEAHATGGQDPGVTVWFHSDGASAIVITRGDSDVLFGAYSSENHERILNKAQFIFRELELHFYWGGSATSVEGSIDLFREAGRELGFM